MSNKKPLITGGASFIGSAVICHIIETTMCMNKIIKKTIQWYLDNKTWCEHVQDGSYQGERLRVVKS